MLDLLDSDFHIVRLVQCGGPVPGQRLGGIPQRRRLPNAIGEDPAHAVGPAAGVTTGARDPGALGKARICRQVEQDLAAQRRRVQRLRGDDDFAQWGQRRQIHDGDRAGEGVEHVAAVAVLGYGHAARVAARGKEAHQPRRAAIRHIDHLDKIAPGEDDVEPRPIRRGNGRHGVVDRRSEDLLIVEGQIGVGRFGLGGQIHCRNGGEEGGGEAHRHIWGGA